VILGLAVATQARQCRVFVVAAVATGLVFTFVVAALVAVLAVGWVSDFRYPVSHNRGPAWALTVNTWLHHCQLGQDTSITVTSGAWFGKAPVTTFSCSSLRR